MTDQDKRHEIAEERLRSWLAGDEAGIRHALILTLLTRHDLSIQEIYQTLSRSFPTSYHSVSGMIGIVSSRIGIVTGTRDEAQRCRLYRIREKHRSLVRRILQSSPIWSCPDLPPDNQHKHFFPDSMTCQEDV
jgi:hypothetical protein